MAGRRLGGGPGEGSAVDEKVEEGAIRLVAFNVRGLRRDLDTITTAIATGYLNDDVVAVSETWLHESEPVPDVHGRDWHDGRRKVAPGVRSSSGVGAWLSTSVPGVTMQVLSTDERCMWMRIDARSMAHGFVALVYGPVNSMQPERPRRMSGGSSCPSSVASTGDAATWW